jgi:hypothetical protein
VDALTERRLLGRPILDHFREVVSRANEPLAGFPATALADNLYLSLRMQRWAGRLASATDRIWPCVTPFLSRDVLSLALNAPAAQKAHDRLIRGMILRLNDGLAALPLAGGYPAVPMRIGNLHRFLPLFRELAGKARGRVFPGRRAATNRDARSDNPWTDPAVAALLEPASMVTRSFYEPSALASLINRSRERDFAGAAHLGRIFTLELCRRRLDEALTLIC